MNLYCVKSFNEIYIIWAESYTQARDKASSLSDEYYYHLSDVTLLSDEIPKECVCIVQFKDLLPR